MLQKAGTESSEFASPNQRERRPDATLLVSSDIARFRQAEWVLTFSRSQS